MVGAHIGLVFVERAYSDIAVAVVGDVDFEDRRFAANKRTLHWDAGAGGVRGDRAVQDRGMRGVDAAFQRLQPVAFLPYLGAVPVAFRHLRPFESRRRGHALLRPHIGPDHPAYLGRRICRKVDLVAELLGLVHLVEAVTLDVKLPAVIDAAQPRLFVAPEP